MKKHFEFSKIIFTMISILTAFVSLFSCALMWRTGDTGPLSYLIPSVFTEMATATGFYYNKSRRENEIKLRDHYGEDVYNDSKEGEVNEYR